MTKEIVAVGTECPLCGGTFYLPEPKYSEMIQRLVRVARAAKELMDTWYSELEDTVAESVDALEHCGYDPDDCIDCGGPPHNEWCRFWKLRHILSYWKED